MRIISFDIFDTCLLRKCGTPSNFYDVLSYKVFYKDVDDDTRKDFAVARRKAEDKVWNDNPKITLQDIYNELGYEHPLLRPSSEMVELELNLERLMLVPSLNCKTLINKQRARGNKIVFISDMYLPSALIKELLVKYGFYEEGDGLYISNEYGLTKQSGELFKKVKEIEGIPYNKWTHWGDNVYSDVKVPKSLGIVSRRIICEYLPYQRTWMTVGQRLYNYSEIAAGVSHALYHSSSNDSHKAFVFDLIAPFYCSYAYKVLENAKSRGVKRLYFCARDTYQLFWIAKAFSVLFPDIEVKYLYISRDALYNGNDAAKQAYFESVGLATKVDDVAIVDITTSGKTILELNNFLVSRGFNKVYGYFFMLWDDSRKIPVDKDWCHFEVEQVRVKNQSCFSGFFNHLSVFENFFALNTQSRTVDYELIDDIAKPIFDSTLTDSETLLANVDYWSRRHRELLEEYTQAFIECELYHYSFDIMHRLSLPVLCSFFNVPEPVYLSALAGYQTYSNSLKCHAPYVYRSSIPHLIMKRGKDSCWSRATILYSIPNCFSHFLHRYYFTHQE